MFGVRQCMGTAGRKIHAGTRHYAVLPLSLAVKPLKCEEGARGGKVHVKLTTNHNIYFHFYMCDAFCATKVRVQIIDFPIA